MSQPYDLSGFATLTATLDQMLDDQAGGSVNFAGSAETWIPAPTGWFKAILTGGGQPTPTTANAVRTALNSVRTVFDLLAGGTGPVAAMAVQAVTPPSLLLETGRSPTGPQQASGPLMNAPPFVANTSYDLSGIAALQAAANAMLADMLSGATSFTGWGETWLNTPRGRFQALLLPSGPAQTVTMGVVTGLMTDLQRRCDLLGTVRGPAGAIFTLDVSILDGPDVLA